jgi:hypothetical protein
MRPAPNAAASAAAAAAAAAAEARLAKLFFFGGCLALPWLWAASLLYFWRPAARLLLPRAWLGALGLGAGGRADAANAAANAAAAAAPDSPELALWLGRSLAGLAAVTALFVGWVAAFQTGMLAGAWPWAAGLLVWAPDPAWWND